MGLEYNDGHGPEGYDIISVPKSKHRIYGPVKYHPLSPVH